MIVLGFIMILLPLFIIVAVWTNLIQKTRCKVILTFIAVYCAVMLGVMGSTANDLEDANNSIDYVIDRDTNYLDCINNSYDDEVFGDCVLENLKLLTETYE